MKSCSVPLKDRFCTLKQHLAGHEHCLPWTCYSLSGSGTVSTTSRRALLFVRYFLSSCCLCCRRGIFVSPGFYKDQALHCAGSEVDCKQFIGNMLCLCWLCFCGIPCAFVVFFVLLWYSCAFVVFLCFCGIG